MSPNRLLFPALAAFALALVPAAAHAQAIARDDAEWLADCRRDDWGTGRERYCEVRDTTLPVTKRLSIDGRQNGGVTVHGWDKQQIVVHARVRTDAETEGDARALAKRVTIVARDGRLYADAPTTGRREGVTVSYDVWLPKQTDLDIEAHNGGIGIEDVEGRMDLETVNGGISLRRVGGDVRGETTNGGVHASLEGTTWRGTGLDLRTTNGGATVEIPASYNARLETGTVNGGFRTDFPITVQGTVGRKLSTQLGSGGPLIRVTTTNGGVALKRK